MDFFLGVQLHFTIDHYLMNLFVRNSLIVWVKFESAEDKFDSFYLWNYIKAGRGFSVNKQVPVISGSFYVPADFDTISSLFTVQ